MSRLAALDARARQFSSFILLVGRIASADTFEVERSLMIIATTIHALAPAELLADDQRERFFTYAPRMGAATPAPLPPTTPEGS